MADSKCDKDEDDDDVGGDNIGTSDGCTDDDDDGCNDEPTAG